MAIVNSMLLAMPRNQGDQYQIHSHLVLYDQLWDYIGQNLSQNYLLKLQQVTESHRTIIRFQKTTRRLSHCPATNIIIELQFFDSCSNTVLS